jgi:hypothetical protein
MSWLDFVPETEIYLQCLKVPPRRSRTMDKLENNSDKQKNALDKSINVKHTLHM